jgi:hypothetical protein
MSLLPPIVEGRISNSFLSQIFLQLPLGKNFWWWKILKSLPLLLKKNTTEFPNFFSKYSFNYLWEEFMVVENRKISSTIIKKTR